MPNLAIYHTTWTRLTGPGLRAQGSGLSSEWSIRTSDSVSVQTGPSRKGVGPRVFRTKLQTKDGVVSITDTMLLHCYLPILQEASETSFRIEFDVVVVNV